MDCDRLPYELEVCPVCGNGIKFTRGWTWIDWDAYAGSHRLGDKCSDELYPFCPICEPDEHSQPYGLLWVGEVFYTPENFIQEAIQMGVSRRIAAVPKNLKLGETWVLFAHIRACGERKDEEDKVEGIPGVFYAFRPQFLELLVWESEATEDKLAELEHRGIRPVIIPDGDVDHDPNTKLKMTEGERSQAEFTRDMQRIRKSLER